MRLKLAPVCFAGLSRAVLDDLEVLGEGFLHR